MKPILLVIFALVAAVFVLAVLAEKKKRTITKQRPLTNREQAMYFKLTSALSEHVVLAQVAFGAMLKTVDTATRNTFDRKRADFVICTKAFDIVAVIELDDASHKGQEAKDRDRDTLLERAGIRTLRYKNVPDEQTVRNDVLNAITTDKNAA